MPFYQEINASAQGPPALEPAEQERRGQLVAGALLDLELAKKKMLDNNANTANGLLTVLRFCGAHDGVAKRVCQWASRVAKSQGASGGSMALVAQGGYGRRQLNLYSDVDILFLLPPSGAERAKLELRLVLYVLFDLKFDLGYIAKTPEQAVDSVGIDLDTATALIEARYLAGDRALYEDLRRRMDKRARHERRKQILQDILRQRESRHESQGASVYVLEPNVKESEGALRDLHTVAWLSYVAFGDTRLRALAENKVWSPSQLRQARASRAFLLRLRNELHAMEGRRVNIIRQGRQHELAERLDYKGDDQFLPEEKLLRDYYMNARRVADLTEGAVDLLVRSGRGVIQGVMERLRRRRVAPHLQALGDAMFLDDKSPDWFRRKPGNILLAAAIAAEKGLRLSERCKGRARRAAEKIDDDFRADPANRDRFMRILRSTAAPEALRMLYETEVLTAYLPEWAHLFCLVRSDFYHAYTVDEHHFKCLEAAGKIRKSPESEEPRVRRAAAEIQRWDLLNFSILLHDVGKALGGAHALRGAQIADHVGLRIGLPEEDRELLRFLVRSHLKMSHVAQRRDLQDDRVIEQFAGEIQDLQRLHMLYIHTVADLRGVGPGAYNDWRSQLLGILYDRAALVLEGKPLKRPERPAILPVLKQGVLERPELSGADEERIDRFLDSLPDRYIAEVKPERAAAHFQLASRLSASNRVEWHLDEGAKSNFSELLVVVHDEPGAFSKICGALASKDINILAAQIHTTTNGIAIDTFSITDASHNRLPSGFRLDRLKRNLNDVLLGKKAIEDLVAQSRSFRRASRQRLARRPTRIMIDNDASSDYTIVEIHTHDRSGLLFDITHALYEKRLSIGQALIGTASYHVVDTLYVTDLEGGKVHGDAEHQALTEALLAAIDGNMNTET
jgi:[protein-PII] uridylyltransferase